MALVVIQARMGSTRLPGKSLMALGEYPVIDWVVKRSASASLVRKVVVATSTNSEDDPLAEHVESALSTEVFRGHPTDVLDRYAGAVAASEDRVIVRVTGDCPFVQPSLIDDAIGDALADGVDYVATDPDGRFPRGFDVEAMLRSALLEASSEAVDPVEREHVTTFIVRRPERFRSRALECPRWAQHPEYRLTLDEEPDLVLLREVVAALDASPDSLDGRAVIQLLEARPDLVALNSSVHHNVVR